MGKYYLVVGPKKFKESAPCEWWIRNGTWANKLIVIPSEKPDAGPGKLFIITYAPENAPPAKYFRAPEDWVVEIPCFKYIDKDPDEQWTAENGKVVRR